MAWRTKGDGLANETDFLELYRELGVSPGCCLLDFKRAYRRHVARLHPDRPGDGQPRVGDQLQQLTAQYSAAMEFQRRHGRLPGAQAEDIRANTPEPSFRSTLPTLTPTREPRRGPSKVTILFALSVTAALFWCTDPLPFLPEVSHAPYIAPSTAEMPEKPVVSTLALGMSSENVRAIEGEPTLIRDDRWEYGPSWIRFENGEVVDWYSSPLQSLKTPAGRPSHH
ncbi:hypothetical protein DYGSA30_33300 [Dyella sp. GSA-30]|nr:hypothetical protein DYGSA30_33300 [Dyella sp. GSA-30]